MPSEAPAAYRKLSRARKTFLYISQLWAADDHLMLVTTLFATERYRRYYFHEIEAMVIRPTNVRRNWMIASGICLALFAGLTAYLAWRSKAATGPSDVFFIMFAFCFGSLAVLSLIVLLIQLVLGPSCQTYLQMRTGLERMNLFNRMRPALRVRDRLTALMAERYPPEPALTEPTLP